MAASRETEAAALFRALAANEAAIQRVFDSARAGMMPEEMWEFFVTELRFA
jgi:hypothetical protein